MFDGYYDLLVGEKASLEDKVARLDQSVGRLSQRVEALVEEKKGYLRSTLRSDVGIWRRRGEEGECGGEFFLAPKEGDFLGCG